MNPSIYESDMIAFTTDVRMEKVEQLKETNGAIEVMFWVKEVMGQWRLKGKAFIIGDDGSEVAERAARSEIAKGLRNKPGDATDGDCWSWEKEVTAYFANHSPLMRGKFYCLIVGWQCPIDQFRFFQRSTSWDATQPKT